MRKTCAELIRRDEAELVLAVVVHDRATPRPVRYAVRAIHQGQSDSPGNLAIVSCEKTDDGAPLNTRPLGGIPFDEPRLPRDVAFAVERRLQEIWNDANPNATEYLDLRAAGFTSSPVVIAGRVGRPRRSFALRAVETRRRLKDPGATDEKAFSEAREHGILKRPPDGRSLTEQAIRVLAEVDDVRNQLLRIAPGADDTLLTEHAREIVDAAIDELRHRE